MKRTFQKILTWANWRWLSAVIGLVATLPALATNPIFVNNSASYYVIPGTPPPAYDVTAFDNENIFSVSYQIYSPSALLYETWNTLNYTNNSTMVVNSPNSTNGFVFGSGYGVGFNFDLHTTSVASPHAMAGTFYNPGVIRCNSTNDGNGLFFGGLGNPPFGLYLVNAIGECLVNATNIIISGIIDDAADGLIDLRARRADLSYSQIYMEEPQSAGFLLGFLFNTAQTPAKMTASGAVGTNFVWPPGFYLTAATALSPPPRSISLTNSTPYVQVRDNGNSNITVRAVFIYDSNPNVPRKVYFGNTPLDPVGNGGATIEWDGVYQDPASGQFFTNYLYLNNDYVWGSSTNVRIFNGIPNNFTFTQTTTPQVPGTLWTNGFPLPFQPLTGITNLYSYVSANFVAGTVATNGIFAGEPTNLPGIISISALDELTLTGAQIGGENYLNLYAPHQFNGSDGAYITAPYADINVGVTNRHLDLANLIANGVSTVGGSVQAWSTRWLYTDSGGTNYDFRAMIVSSALTAQSQSWIKNMNIHAEDSVVIHDVLNVYKTFYFDGVRLTLETNGYGNGFTSPNGAINWAVATTFGPTQIPNVRWLTNNGALTALNDAIFGTSSARYGAFLNHGLLADQGTTIWTLNFENGGVITNGSGAFTLQTDRAVMTNGAIFANGSVSLTTSNLFVTNEVIFAGRSLNITTLSNLSDAVTPCGTSANFWSVGQFGNTGDGIFLAAKPVGGDLLGTTVTNYAAASKIINFEWAGQDRGYSLAGFSNNAALGHIVLDATGSGKFKFFGAAPGSAIYVDSIEFKDSSTNTDAGGNMLGITFSNLVIYYAQAIKSGESIAEKLNLKNTNNGVDSTTSHFRWLPQYAGYFSGTNLVYPDGTTNCVNAALAQSTYDSDKDGIPNYLDPTPFFVPSQINFSLTITNPPVGNRARLSWWTIPFATNSVLCKTNLRSPNWIVLTNFVSPQPTNGPATNVIVLDAGVTNAVTTRFYRICVTPAFP